MLRCRVSAFARGRACASFLSSHSRPLRSCPPILRSSSNLRCLFIDGGAVRAYTGSMTRPTGRSKPVEPENRRKNRKKRRGGRVRPAAGLPQGCGAPNPGAAPAGGGLSRDAPPPCGGWVVHLLWLSPPCAGSPAARWPPLPFCAPLSGAAPVPLRAHSACPRFPF